MGQQLTTVFGDTSKTESGGGGRTDVIKKDEEV
jgi:hypothetical protein